ncbi:hypothetical protein LCGC14_1386870 [marine sediment metagenome]|uniref:SprT-like domain-containing protein n=1 Tax=marine sediment metagenome TaxID=412755 RepID=A0A0F9MGM7_9ZZZZ
MKTAMFRGSKYGVDLCGPIDGSCQNPKEGGLPWLRICVPLNKRRGLITAIHESLHACSFLKSEEAVTETAEDIGRFLWRLGYRHVED